MIKIMIHMAQIVQLFIIVILGGMEHVGAEIILLEEVMEIDRFGQVLVQIIINMVLFILNRRRICQH